MEIVNDKIISSFRHHPFIYSILHISVTNNLRLLFFVLCHIVILLGWCYFFCIISSCVLSAAAYYYAAAILIFFFKFYYYYSSSISAGGVRNPAAAMYSKLCAASGSERSAFLAIPSLQHDRTRNKRPSAPSLRYLRGMRWG